MSVVITSPFPRTRIVTQPYPIYPLNYFDYGYPSAYYPLTSWPRYSSPLAGNFPGSLQTCDLPCPLGSVRIPKDSAGNLCQCLF